MEPRVAVAGQGRPVLRRSTAPSSGRSDSLAVAAREVDGRWLAMPSAFPRSLQLLRAIALLGALLAVAPAARADPPSAGARASPAPGTDDADPLLDERLAHACVLAAWRASGLGEDDAKIDSMIARANVSAALPETSVRAMQLWSEANDTSTVTTSDATTLYDVLGSHFVLDVRLTWKLDRLLYAGDEAALERIRVERHEARSRLATRTLDALFALARAQVDAADAVPRSREAVEAHLRAAEATATLEVLTGGWFSQAR
jgi:hypothetical protein